MHVLPHIPICRFKTQGSERRNYPPEVSQVDCKVVQTFDHFLASHTLQCHFVAITHQEAKFKARCGGAHL
jgi:hypothetical protein